MRTVYSRRAGSSSVWFTSVHGVRPRIRAWEPRPPHAGTSAQAVEPDDIVEAQELTVRTGTLHSLLLEAPGRWSAGRAPPRTSRTNPLPELPPEGGRVRRAHAYAACRLECWVLRSGRSVTGLADDAELAASGRDVSARMRPMASSANVAMSADTPAPVPEAPTAKALPM